MDISKRTAAATINVDERDKIFKTGKMIMGDEIDRETKML